MTLQEAQSLGIDSLKSFSEGLLDLIDLGTDVAKDGFGVDDLVQAIRIPGIVDDLKEAPLAVAQLLDIDESEYNEVKDFISDKVEDINDGLSGEKVEKIAGKVLISAVNLLLIINDFRK